MSCLLFICTSLASPFDLGLRLSPVFRLPLGSGTTEYFSVGGGAFLNAEIDLLRCVSIGPEIGFTIDTLDGPSSVAQFLSAGLSLSGFYYPLSRMIVRGGASLGVYDASYEDVTAQDLYWRGYAEAGFRFTPSISLSATGGYIKYLARDPEPLYAGLTMGLSVRYLIDTDPALGSISANLTQLDPVFPLFYGMYKENSVGTLRITNNESAEIRNVKVTFGAGNYTNSQMPCGTVDVIGKRKSVDVPLFADFSTTVLNFTENGKMPGEVIVTYDLLGSGRVTPVTVVVDVLNRNTMRWTDLSAVAAFISPNSPEVLDLSKYLVGIARDRLRSGLNRNMQFAMYLYEGLRSGNLAWSHDSTTPYTEYHLDPAKLDYVQYPFQTLAYGSGDYDDLGILYAALLESVGIKTAIIPMAGDFVVLFSLGITPEEASGLFSSADNYMEMEEEVWIPLSLAVFREGFMNSWYNAMNELGPALRGEESVELILLQTAWQSYPPSGIAGKEAQFEKPAEETVVKAVETVMMRYITAEFGPKIKAIQERIRSEGGTSSLFGELGLLYVRAGMYPEAKGEYKKAAKMGSVPAMINLGNIALLERDYKTAESWFKQALAEQPESKAARQGLEKARGELEN